MRTACFVPLVASLFLASCGLIAGPAKHAKLTSSYVWAHPNSNFGGISGIEVSDDGRSLIAINDKSRVFFADIDRKNQEIIGVSSLISAPLLDQKGREITKRKRDSEGLAAGPDGRYYVSFEGDARIVAYDDLQRNALAAWRHPEFNRLPVNASLELLAISPDGRLITFAEEAGGRASNMPVFEFSTTQAQWQQRFFITSEPPFLPVGADFGPDGRFYLLERHLQGVLGFQSRVRRFDFDENGFSNPTTLLTTLPGTHDNLEGISVWRDDSGLLRLTMVADDNFMFFQETQLVEYIIKP